MTYRVKVAIYLVSLEEEGYRAGTRFMVLE